MNKEVIIANKEAFEYWLKGGAVMGRCAKNNSWGEIKFPQWDSPSCKYVPKDEWWELKAAQVDGLVIEFRTQNMPTSERRWIVHTQCYFGHPACCYRIKKQETFFTGQCVWAGPYNVNKYCPAIVGTVSIEGQVTELHSLEYEGTGASYNTSDMVFEAWGVGHLKDGALVRMWDTQGHNQPTIAEWDIVAQDVYGPKSYKAFDFILPVLRGGIIPYALEWQVDKIPDGAHFSSDDLIGSYKKVLLSTCVYTFKYYDCNGELGDNVRPSPTKRYYLSDENGKRLL